jgi:NhaP-type Na+/H+ and K+/H+ antiporter
MEGLRPAAAFWQSSLLTSALGAFVAQFVFPRIVARTALISSILAPTDAAKAIVIYNAIPIRVRRALNFESGPNDGNAVLCDGT